MEELQKLASEPRERQTASSLYNLWRGNNSCHVISVRERTMRPQFLVLRHVWI